MAHTREIPIIEGVVEVLSLLAKLIWRKPATPNSKRRIPDNVNKFAFPDFLTILGQALSNEKKMRQQAEILIFFE